MENIFVFSTASQPLATNQFAQDEKEKMSSCSGKVMHTLVIRKIFSTHKY